MEFDLPRRGCETSRFVLFKAQLFHVHWIFARENPVHMEKLRFKKYETTGFATPSGKVELHSSILESLGFDPLPYYRAEPVAQGRYPFMAFTGIREPEFFQTGQRHIASLRARNPEPRAFLNADDARSTGVKEDDW